MKLREFVELPRAYDREERQKEEGLGTRMRLEVKGKGPGKEVCKILVQRTSMYPLGKGLPRVTDCAIGNHSRNRGQ